MHLTDDLPFAYGAPPLRGVLRASAADFDVDEELGFTPEGVGEHLYLRIEKCNANTEWVAEQLARLAGVKPDCVSYAGMKDRHAVARQTFSVHLPGKSDGPDWLHIENAQFRVLQATRHSRKLKRGALKGNKFIVVVRAISGDHAAVETRLAAITAGGVPNYFGEQRFGRGGANIERATAMFAGARIRGHERALLLSAARSALFNAVLAERVAQCNWNAPLPGEVWMLAGTHSIFGPETATPALLQRFASGDIGLTGPLWGLGGLRSSDAVAELERNAVMRHASLADGLEKNGLNQERRALALLPTELQWNWLDDDALELRFALRAGCYATTLLRELCAWS